MSKKRKQTDAPQRPEDCHTIEQKVAYSTMIRSKWEALAESWGKPSAIDDLLDAYPYDPAYPHSHPELAAHYTRAEEEKGRALKREARRQTNRFLYSVPPKDR